MKRFYKNVAAHNGDDGHYIHLDGKAVKTPAQSFLCVTGSALATAIAAEWAAQGDDIRPETMPMTQWVITEIDRVRPQRTKLQQEILGYIDTDLLCYRASPESEIGKLQATAWDPVLDWVTDTYGARPTTTTKLDALTQPEQLHATLRDYVTSLPDDFFTVLYVLTCETGSLFLGLAALKNAFDDGVIFTAARVEEEYKKTLYKEDIHGSAPDQEKREEKLRQELASARQLLSLITT